MSANWRLAVDAVHTRSITIILLRSRRVLRHNTEYLAAFFEINTEYLAPTQHVDEAMIVATERRERQPLLQSDDCWSSSNSLYNVVYRALLRLLLVIACSKRVHVTKQLVLPTPAHKHGDGAGRA